LSLLRVYTQGEKDCAPALLRELPEQFRLIRNLLTPAHVGYMLCKLVSLCLVDGGPSLRHQRDR
jgi:hypothetical protein